MFSQRSAFGFALASSFVLLGVGWILVNFLPRRLASPKIRVLAMSESGRQMAAGTAEGAIRIWDLKERNQALRLESSPGTLNDLRFTADERFLAIANRNLTLVQLEATRSKIEIVADESNYGSVRFSPDGNSILTINGKGAILLVDLRSKSVAEKHCCSTIWGDVDFGLDGSLALWAGHWPGVLDLHSGRLLGRLTATPEVMTFGPVFIDRFKNSIFMGSQDGRVYQWDLGTRKLLRTSPAQAGYIRTISPLGRSGYIAFASDSGPVKLWNPETGNSRTVPDALTTRNLIFDGNRNLTAIGTAKGEVEFWDLLPGRMIEKLQ